MGRKLGKVLLFLWRMLYPMMLYELISAVVIVGGFAVVAWLRRAYWRMAGADQSELLSQHLALLFAGLGALVAAIPLGLLYAFFRWRRDEARVRSDGNFADRPKERAVLHMSAGAAVRLAVLGFSMCLLGNCILLSLPLPWDSYDEISEVLYTPSLAIQLLCIGLILPFTEELVFRGLGYARMRTMLPVIPSMLISSVYFGIYHGNLLQAVYATSLGLGMAWAMECYDAMSASYIIHASANIMSVVISNTIVGGLLVVFDVFRWGTAFIGGAVSILIFYKIRKDRKNYETSVSCDSLL